MTVKPGGFFHHVHLPSGAARPPHAQLSGLAPSNGALDITLTMKPGAVFGYLGVLELIEQDGGVELTPRTLTPRMTTVPKIYNGPMGYYASLPRGVAYPQPL